MILLAPFLIVGSLIFGAVATDQFVRAEFMHPKQDRMDQVMRGILGLCALAAAFAAGLVL